MKALNLAEEKAKITTKYSDSALLDVIEVLQDKHDLYYREAWAELHTRYSSIILKAARDKTYTYRFDSPEELAEDLAFEVFKKILNKIDQCPLDDSLSGDTHKQHVKFVRWVFGIINNSFIDVTRKNEKLQSAVKAFSHNDVYIDKGLEDFELEGQKDSDSEEKYDIQMAQLDRAINSLTEDEKLIIMTYRDYGYIENGKWILPAEYKILLQDKLGIKSNSLDRKKTRTVAKLKKKILDK